MQWQIEYLPFSVKTHRRIEQGLVMLAFLLSYLMMPVWDVASAEGGLTDLFYTKSFQGSWEVMAKFSFLGVAMNFIISVFCWLGLFFVIYQRMISILYLAGRPTWDAVWDIKESNKGSFFGIPATMKDIFNGNRGTGIDAVMGFVHSILPNVRAYSDYNPNKLQHNLQEDDTIATYMMKTALPTILMVFVFCIGFSGTLVKGYAVVADGIAAAADRAVDVNLAAYVNRVVDAGEAYTFTIGDQGSEEAKIAEKIGKDVYGQVLSKMGVLSTEDRMAVGKAVEQWVWTDVLGSNYNTTNLVSLVNKTNASVGTAAARTSLTPEEVKALKYDVIVNMGTAGGNVSTGQNLGTTPKAMSSFLPQGFQAKESGKDYYVTVLVKQGKVSDTNFFIKRQN